MQLLGDGRVNDPMLSAPITIQKRNEDAAKMSSIHGYNIQARIGVLLCIPKKGEGKKDTRSYRAILLWQKEFGVNS